LGSAVINLGGTTTQLVVQKGSAVLYNYFLPVGSEHITNDISVTFHTPYSAANMIKKQYATLLPSRESENENELNIKKVKLPILGNESESKEISLDQIQPILHARVEETLYIIYDKLLESSAIESIDGGIILTGGMTHIPGIKELASMIFQNIPVKIANPKNIQNGYINFNTPSMSTIVGLLLYELDNQNNFELDSNKELRQNNTNPLQNNKMPYQMQNNQTLSNLNDIQDIKTLKKQEKYTKGLSGLFDKISRWL
jgi:cell division protein FtsA